MLLSRQRPAAVAAAVDLDRGTKLAACTAHFVGAVFAATRCTDVSCAEAGGATAPALHIPCKLKQQLPTVATASAAGLMQLQLAAYVAAFDSANDASRHQQHPPAFCLAPSMLALLTHLRTHNLTLCAAYVHAQVAAVVPLLKLLLPGMRVLFYCHFPDLLLSQRGSFIKSLYRMPLDYLEEVATGSADLILVNSNFTAGVFGQTFKRLAAQGVQPAVLYPAAAIPAEAELQEAQQAWREELPADLVQHISKGPTFLSINR